MPATGGEPNLPPYKALGELPRSLTGSDSYTIDTTDATAVAIYVGDAGNTLDEQLGLQADGASGDYYHTGIDGTETSSDSSVPLPLAKDMAGTWIELSAPDGVSGTIQPATSGSVPTASPAVGFRTAFVGDALDSVTLFNRETTTAFDLAEVEVYSR